MFYYTGGDSGGITVPGKLDSGATVTTHSTLSESLYVLYFFTLFIYREANGNESFCTCYDSGTTFLLMMCLSSLDTLLFRFI